MAKVTGPVRTQPANPAPQKDKKAREKRWKTISIVSFFLATAAGFIVFILPIILNQPGSEIKQIDHQRQDTTVNIRVDTLETLQEKDSIQ